MGWTSIRATMTNKQLYADQLANQYGDRATVLGFSINGNEIYQLVQTEKGIFIGLIIVSRHDGEIFWKQLDESCFPYYFKCPAKFLNRSTCTSGSAEKWRSECRRLHQEKAKGQDLISRIKALKNGDRVEMQSGRVVVFEFNYNRVRFAGKLADVQPGKQNSTFAWSYKEVAKIL